MCIRDRSKSLREKSAHEQHIESEALLTSMGDGAITTDEYGKITRVNPAALHMLGYSEKELIDSWLPRKIIAEDLEGHRAVSYTHLCFKQCIYWF